MPLMVCAAATSAAIAFHGDFGEDVAIVSGWHNIAGWGQALLLMLLRACCAAAGIPCMACRCAASARAESQWLARATGA